MILSPVERRVQYSQWAEKQFIELKNEYSNLQKILKETVISLKKFPEYLKRIDDNVKLLINYPWSNEFLAQNRNELERLIENFKRLAFDIQQLYDSLDISLPRPSKLKFIENTQKRILGKLDQNFCFEFSLIDVVADFLDTRSLAKSSRTCRSWKNVFSQKQIDNLVLVSENSQLIVRASFLKSSVKLVEFNQAVKMTLAKQPCFSFFFSRGEQHIQKDLPKALASAMVPKKDSHLPIESPENVLFIRIMHR